MTSTLQVCSTLSAFLLKFRNSYQRNHHAKRQYLKISYFVAVEKKREVGRASEFTETYCILSLQRVSFIIDFILIMIKCVGPIWAINLVCLAVPRRLFLLPYNELAIAQGPKIQQKNKL